jgi:hypothetical protein
MKHGYSVYCPFLDFQIALHEYGYFLTKEDFQRNSMAWVEVCDAMLMLPNWDISNGAKREMQRAKDLGIPVCFSFRELIDLTHSIYGK